MTEVWFYHLEQATVEQTLPKLLEKTLAAGQRALVLTRSEARAEDLARHLWSYAPDSWLPHGTTADGNPAQQPVWITNQAQNLNEAGFLFLLDAQDWSAQAPTPKTGFSRVLDLFDGTDPDAVQAARDRWRADKAAGLTLSYWQQSPDGVWTKKA